MSDSTSRTVATLGIWPSTAWALSWVFRASWTGNLAQVMMAVIVAFICGSAVAGTAFVWRGASSPAPATKPARTPEEEWART